jgi:hypothetical protein
MGVCHSPWVPCRCNAFSMALLGEQKRNPAAFAHKPRTYLLERSLILCYFKTISSHRRPTWCAQPPGSSFRSLSSQSLDPLCSTAIGENYRFIMATSAIVMTPTGLPGAGGKCGWQNGNAACLPMQGRTCCSINGFVYPRYCGPALKLTLCDSFCGNNET